jgi:transcriptional regulator with XRE-family HTH domain
MVLPEKLAAVVGRNCKRIRTETGITQDEFARYARSLGLRWKASTVADFEAGRSAPTFATVLAASLALHSAARNEAARQGDLSVSVLLSELFVAEDGEQIQLNDDLHLPAALVVAVCEGRSWGSPPWNLWVPTPGLETKESLEFWREMMPGDDVVGSPSERLLLRSGVTEDRLSRRLGIDLARLADLSYLLWERTFSEERDQRAGPDASQQKKGRVSRELRAELERELTNGDD